MYHQKKPYHAILLNLYAKSNQNTKKSYKHCQESFMPESTSLNIWLTIHAELYCLSKKLDQNKINLPLCKYIKTNNNLCTTIQQHFKNKLTKNAFTKGPIKRQCTTIKQAFIKN